MDNSRCSCDDSLLSCDGFLENPFKNLPYAFEFILKIKDPICKGILISFLEDGSFSIYRSDLAEIEARRSASNKNGILNLDFTKNSFRESIFDILNRAFGVIMKILLNS